MKPLSAELGVLLDRKQLQRALDKKYGFEYIPFYVDAASKIGDRVIFFADDDVQPDGLIEAYEVDRNTGEMSPGIYELPKVIHNRILCSQPGASNVCRAAEVTHSRMFNRVTRFNKWDVQRFLHQDEALQAYLLRSSLLSSKDQVRNWLREYPEVYIKPCSGSLGTGVMRLSWKRNHLSIFSQQQIHQTRGQGVAKLQRVLHNVSSRPFLIQEGARLIRLKDQPVDFRVTVQKGKEGNWVVSGIVAKLGLPGTYVTNLARGGRSLPAREVLDSLFGSSESQTMYERLAEAGLLICQRLEHFDRSIADMGLDLAVTRGGSVKFIEANGRDLRITFRNANEHKMWRHTYQNPMLYGHYLLSEGGEECGKSVMEEC